MVATNDDLLFELQKQTEILKKMKGLIKGTYVDVEVANQKQNDTD